MSRRSRKNRRTAAQAASNPPRDSQAKAEERRTEIGSLNSSRLELDYSYQRPTEPERVRSIVSQFDPALVNLLKVSARDGHYYVFDGGHTLAALRTINGNKDFPVLCKIYYGLTYEEEAILDGYGLGDRYTAVATYTGTATGSYVKGYTVTADYTGTVSHIALDRVRYVAIFEGTRIAEPEEETGSLTNGNGAPAEFPWSYVLVPVGIVAVAGAGLGAALALKRRGESAGAMETEADTE